jgi:eukaryotic-like serine/threonine-protein kinase
MNDIGSVQLAPNDAGLQDEIPAASPTEKPCPKCSAANLIAELPAREYRCGCCGLELAHLDTLPNGGVRGVLGWLLDCGTTVNERYRVAAVLGKGGFGVTYLVDDLRLHGKRRALKEVPAMLFDEYETRLLGRLNHPAIPDITDRFNADGMVYQVLEFGGDRTLRIEQERRGGRIPLFVLLPWVRQLCAALEYLHAQDPPVIHRDLKPDNVLLDEHQRVMLIDFGIAKEASASTMTRTIGRAVTQGFSPPEQVLGTGTDARSDVYALGAIMYFCLTGQMPAAAHERITGHIVEPLSTMLPEIPPLIEAAVAQALELNINLRQQSIAELAAMFELIDSGSGSARTVVVSPSRVGTVHTGGVALPSVQLSSLQTGGFASTSSVRVGAPGAVTTATPPRRRIALIATATVVILSVSGIAGYALWLDRGPPTEIPAGEASVVEPRQPVVAAEPESGSETSAAAVTDTGSPEAATGQEPVPNVLSTPSAPAPSTATVTPAEPTFANQTVPADQSQDGTPPDSHGPVASPDTASEPAFDASPAAISAGAAAAATAAAARSGGAPVLPATAPSSPGRLPSIFSDEQPVTSRAAVQGNAAGASGTGGLLDLFESHRANSLSATPSVSEPTPASTATPGATAKAAPKPATPAKVNKPTPPPKQKSTTTQAKSASPNKAVQTKPSTQTKPGTGQTSDWGFQYKGARKTD